MSAIEQRPLTIRLLLRFATTTTLLAPYVLVFLPLAIWNGNPGTDFIVYTGALAVGGAFLVEASVAAVVYAERRRRSVPRAPRSVLRSGWLGDRVSVIARIVALVSIVANLGAAMLGAGTLESQVSGHVPSGIATVLTPFNSWAHVALALLIAAHFLGGASRGATLWWIAALLVTQVAVAYISNITVLLGALTVLTITLVLLTRIVRVTIVAVGVAAIAIVWPTVFAIRNGLREANGIDVDTSASAASDRLRFDEQIARAEEYGAGHDIGQPDFWGAIRYGLVPRFLDPGRPALSSGNLINEFLGGSEISSYTFLPVATVWFFWGALAVVLSYAAWALFITLLRPWHALERRPIAITLVVLAIGGPLSMLATPPDALSRMLQTVVSIAPVLLALQFWARRPARSDHTAPLTAAVRQVSAIGSGDVGRSPARRQR